MIFHGQVVLPPHRICMIRIFLILFTVRIYTMIRMSRETYNWAAHGAQSWARLRCVWPLIQPTPELSSTTLTPWTQPTNSSPASMGEAIANPSNEPQVWIDFLRLWIYGVDTSSPWRSTQLLNGWTRDLNLQRFLIQSLYLQKTSGQGVRTHPPMVLLAIVREGDIDQLAFY